MDHAKAGRRWSRLRARSDSYRALDALAWHRLHLEHPGIDVTARCRRRGLGAEDRGHDRLACGGRGRRRRLDAGRLVPGRPRRQRCRRSLGERRGKDRSGERYDGGDTRGVGDRGRCRGWLAGREELQRVEVAVRVGGHSDAEVDMRPRGDEVVARAKGAHGLPLGDRLRGLDGQGRELQQRRGEAVARQDRDGSPTIRHGPRKRDDAGGRGAHALAELATDVDTPVLAPGVRIGAEPERAHDGARHRPRPGVRRRREQEDRHRGERPAHDLC